MCVCKSVCVHTGVRDPEEEIYRFLQLMFLRYISLLFGRNGSGILMAGAPTLAVRIPTETQGTGRSCGKMSLFYNAIYIGGERASALFPVHCCLVSHLQRIWWIISLHSTKTTPRGSIKWHSHFSLLSMGWKAPW